MISRLRHGLATAGLGILLLVCMSGCAHGPGPSNVASATIDKKLVSSATDFGFDLYRELIAGGTDENILISPASLAAALAMTYNGAAGQTKLAMAQVLGLEDLELDDVNHGYAHLLSALTDMDPEVQLDIANSLWACDDVAFKPEFLDANDRFYKAEIKTLDFACPTTPDLINSWIRDQTGKRIEKVIDRIDPDVILYLINANYFKAKWATLFDREYTELDDFLLADGTTKRVPMMMSQGKGYRYYRGDGFEAVALPYGNGRISMYAFLPVSDSDLAEFYEQLNEATWTQWMSAFSEQTMLVRMPRFKIEYSAVLNTPLRTLGMGPAFNRADFRNMTSTPAFISMVKHGALIEVTEEGTEAAGATAVEMKKSGIGRVVFDHPFFFAICDNVTGMILFMGTLAEP